VSIVAAARFDGRVVMGCDSVVSAGSRTYHSGTKIHRFGDALLGVVGECRVELRVVRDLRAETAHAVDEDFVSDTLLQLTKKDRAALELVLAKDGALWEFCDGQPSLVEESHFAIGAAAEVALGAMWPVPDSDPESRVRCALDACAYHHRGSVGAPFFVESV